MKINRLGWIAALALTGIVATIPIATAAEGDERPNRERREGGGRGTPAERVKRLTASLELTEAQQKQVTALFEAQTKEMQKLRELPQEERREKFGKLREEFDGKFKALLTAEQKTKYAKVQEEQRGRRNRPQNDN